MTQSQMEEIFHIYGLSHLYQKLSYPLWITGFMENIDCELLEEFFESYEFERVDKIFVDDFLYQFRTFTIAYECFH